jgi:hypothetical protein
MTGFFEESEGVHSMTRLTIFLLTWCTIALTGALCWYLLFRHPEASVIVAVGGVLITLVIHGSVAIVNRNGPSDQSAPAKPDGGSTAS